MSTHTSKKKFIIAVLEFEVPRFIHIYFHLTKDQIDFISDIILDNIHEKADIIHDMVEADLNISLGIDVIREIFRRYRDLANVYDHLKIPHEEVCPYGDAECCPDDLCSLWHPAKSTLTLVPENRVPTLCYADDSTLPTVYPDFLRQCTCFDSMCIKRHQTSNHLCRNGGECPRINCTYYHDYSQDCKYGSSCRYEDCPFNHENCPQSWIVNNYEAQPWNTNRYETQSWNVNSYDDEDSYSGRASLLSDPIEKFVQEAVKSCRLSS
ncbi:uncharacterized protein KGF55_001658 [Candida pseudojiufengensis]|uniref:uncharacterized protein n=1 Tax=Candida pseudojiufengensis TaxID=497109 RepID=UPI0022259FA8|nr:uncharacterized protein KGF55_001658 [Candida pseudojiufengensis]KAI5964589.1 hypothetical protein KGF55_001658 [Candida pseudojiufengensis]